MNRRSFLKLFGAGLPAAVVAEKIGLVGRIRSYFFAPPGGWCPRGIDDARLLALQLEAMAPYIQQAIEADHELSFYFGALRYYDSMPAGRYLGISRAVYPKMIEFDQAVLIG